VRTTPPGRQGTQGVVSHTQPQWSGLLLRPQLGLIQATSEPLHTLLRSSGCFGGAEVKHLPSGDAPRRGKHRRDLLSRTAPALPSHLPGGDGDGHLLPCSLWLFPPPSRLRHSRGSTPGHPAGTGEGGEPCREPWPRDRESIWLPASKPSIAFLPMVLAEDSQLGAQHHHSGASHGTQHPARCPTAPWLLPSCSPDVWEGAFTGAPPPTPGRPAPLLPPAQGAVSAPRRGRGRACCCGEAFCKRRRC